jgi:hypothetical protein
VCVGSMHLLVGLKRGGSRSWLCLFHLMCTSWRLCLVPYA